MATVVRFHAGLLMLEYLRCKLADWRRRNEYYCYHCLVQFSTGAYGAAPYTGKNRDELMSRLCRYPEIKRVVKIGFEFRMDTEVDPDYAFRQCQLFPRYKSLATELNMVA